MTCKILLLLFNFFKTYSKNVTKCESLVNSKKYLLIFPNQILLHLQCVQNEYIRYAIDSCPIGVSADSCPTGAP